MPQSLERGIDLFHLLFELYEAPILKVAIASAQLTKGADVLMRKEVSDLVERQDAIKERSAPGDRDASVALFTRRRENISHPALLRRTGKVKPNTAFDSRHLLDDTPTLPPLPKLELRQPHRCSCSAPVDGIIFVTIACAGTRSGSGGSLQSSVCSEIIRQVSLDVSEEKTAAFAAIAPFVTVLVEEIHSSSHMATPARRTVPPLLAFLPMLVADIARQCTGILQCCADSTYPFEVMWADVCRVATLALVQPRVVHESAKARPRWGHRRPQLARGE